MPGVDVVEVRRRLARLGQQRVSTGLLSARGVAALRAVGFSQVSEVIGGVAITVPQRGFFSTGPGGWPRYPRGWQGGPEAGAPPPVYTSSAPPAGVPSWVTALRSGYRIALTRMIEEARAVGADGVVGVQVQRRRTMTAQVPVWSFLATGTAIRATGGRHAGTPFTAALSAAETASAMRSGFVPVSYLACPVMAIRWVEPASRGQERLSAANGEIEAYTETVNACRRQAAADFARAAHEAHADAAVLTDMTVELGPAKDAAEVTVVITGTALTQFDARSGAAPLRIVSLGWASDE